MSKLTLIGNIQHGEKYTNKDGEEKWKNTDLGTLFHDPEKGEYVVKYLGLWCRVWPAKFEQKHFDQAKEAVRNTQPHSIDNFSDEIPFDQPP